MAKIRSVSPTCGLCGRVKEGDDLISLNGKKITDCFDMMYHFDGLFTSPWGRPVSKRVRLTVERDGELLNIKGKSDKGELGLEFDTFLMDEPRSCKNKSRKS
jgi:hypothetical protein